MRHSLETGEMVAKLLSSDGCPGLLPQLADGQLLSSLCILSSWYIHICLLVSLLIRTLVMLDPGPLSLPCFNLITSL